MTAPRITPIDIYSIISTVLSWDIKDLESRASKIERERAKLGKDQLRILKEYTNKPQREQDRIRKDSQRQSLSIVTAILRDSKCSSTELTDFHHQQALEYLAIHLSIRDRRQLIQCLCKASPDHLTVSVREVLEAYEPVIRRMHKAVDLASTLSDFEYFLKDLIKLAKIHTDKVGKSIVPTVGDFVQLLRKHQRAGHVFLHQCCKNDKELTGWYLEWAKQAASHFKRQASNYDDNDDPYLTGKGAGKLTRPLHGIFSSLPEDTQTRIIPILDSHSAFLDKMHAQSSARLASVLKSPPSKNPAIAKIFANSAASRPPSRSSSPPPQIDPRSASTPTLTGPNGDEADATIPEVSSSPGPGAFLARWQALLDATPITPLTQSGPLKAASSPEVVQASAADVDGKKLVQFASQEAKGEKIRVEEPERQDGKKKNTADNDPAGIGLGARERQKDLKVVIDAMGTQFRQLLAEQSCYW